MLAVTEQAGAQRARAEDKRPKKRCQEDELRCTHSCLGGGRSMMEQEVLEPCAWVGCLDAGEKRDMGEGGAWAAPERRDGREEGFFEEAGASWSFEAGG